MLDDAAASAQVKRAVFEAELKEKLRADREKELRFCVALGEDRLTEAQIEGEPLQSSGYDVLLESSV